MYTMNYFFQNRQLMDKLNTIEETRLSMEAEVIHVIIISITIVCKNTLCTCTCTSVCTL